MTAYIIVAAFLAGLLVGGFSEYEFHLASQTTQAYRSLAVAQTGEATIIKDTQTVTKDISHDKKDPCLNDAVPADINKLLH